MRESLRGLAPVAGAGSGAGLALAAGRLIEGGPGHALLLPALAVLFYLFRKHGAGRAALAGAAAGATYAAVGCYWLPRHEVAAYLSSVLLVGAAFAAAGALASALGRAARGRTVAGAFAGPAALLSLAFAFSFTPLGSVWALPGDLAPARLLGAAAGIGGDGVAAALFFAAAAVAAALERRAGEAVLATCACAGFALAGVYAVIGPERAPGKGQAPVRAAIVQPDLPYDWEWRKAHRDEILARLVALTRGGAAGADLVVWPQYELPGEVVPPEAAALARELNASIVLGTYEGDRNVVVCIAPDGSARVLGAQRPPPYREQAPGEEGGLFSVRGVPFGVLLCFDDVEPGPARDLGRAGARFLCALSNDAVFLGTREPELHLNRARLRAAETGRPVLRAIPQGVSAVISDRGRVIARAEAGTQAVLRAEIQPREDLTPYVRARPARYALYVGVGLLVVLVSLRVLALVRDA